MECSHAHIHSIALRHPGEDEFHQQLSSAEVRIEDPAGVSASGTYVSDGLGLSLWHNNASELSLPLRERRGPVCSPVFTNGNARGLLIAVAVDQCDCGSGEGLRVRLEMIDAFSRKPVPLHGSGPLITTMGTHLYLFHSDYDPSPNFFKEILRVPVPPFWRLRMEPQGESPIVYAVTHSYLV